MATDGTLCVTVNNSMTTIVKTLVNDRQPSLTSTHLQQSYINYGHHSELVFDKFMCGRSRGEIQR